MKRQVKIGLQTKAVLALALMVLSATLAGGAMFHRYLQAWSERTEQAQAEALADTLGRMASGALEGGDDPALRQIAHDSLSNQAVLYVAFLDAGGREVATASRASRGQAARPLVPEPVTLRYTRPAADDCLLVARPILAGADGAVRPVGALRMTMSMHAAAARLNQAHRVMLLMACVLVAASIPLGYLLVWRVLGVPLKRLTRATRHLAEGDLSARASVARNDELGELARSFNSMAGQLEAQRKLLLSANELLEQSVRRRTRQLKRANDRLRHEVAEKEDFLRAVSHDLNAPLRNVSGLASMVLLKWRASLPEEVVARLERIQANVETQAQLINELLELSRIRSRPGKRERVDMGELMRELRETFEFDLRQKGVELSVAEGMPELWVEKSRMRQVFQNLVDNAVKYLGERADKRIEIAYERREDEHVFRVTDNGPGIPAEEHERIFQVFRRATGAAAGGVPGKGVGLSTVRSIVGNYEGRVWVSSRPGEGATFFVALPQGSMEQPENADDVHHATTDEADGLEAHRHPAGGR